MVMIVRANCRSKYLLVLAAAVFTLPFSAVAERIELKNGTVYEGAVLGEDPATVVIETKDGIRNVNKSDLKTLPAGVLPAGSMKPTVKAVPVIEQPEAEVPVNPVEMLKSAQDLQKAYKEANPETGPVDPEKAENLKQEMNSSKQKLRRNPMTSWLINYASESQAKSELRKINSAVSLFLMEEERMPKDMEELAGKISSLGPRYKRGIIDDYHYTFEGGQENYKIVARPTDWTYKLTAFVLDSSSGKIKNRK